MRVIAPVTALAALIIFTLVSPPRATAQESGVGLIERISGTAFWRQNPAAKPERLDPRSDAARRLYPGEQVRCARGSRLTLLLGHKRKLVPCADWFTIPPTASPQSEPVKRMLSEYGRPGGIRRGDSSQVFSPADHSVVAPGKFAVRWIPGVAGCALSLAIRDVGGHVIWQQDRVDARSGSLRAVSARQRLTSYRTLAGLGPLTLTSNDSCSGETQVTFTLLSVENEHLLKQTLAYWGKDAVPLVRHLGLASAFSRYRMYPEAADEYEAALRFAPYSRDLLTRTIIAHRLTGNLERAGKLEKRLPVGTDVP